jgi:hypothetical protein
MKDIDNKLLRIRLERNKQIYDALRLRYESRWWEDLPLILLVSGLFFWFGTTDTGTYIHFYMFLIVIGWFSAKIKRLHQRVDVLIEVLDSEIEEALASKLKGGDEDSLLEDENLPHGS